MSAVQGMTIDEPGTGRLEVWPIPVVEEGLVALLSTLFTDHWREITFGPLIQGAAYEISPLTPPERLSTHDGYLTVEWPGMHFHICLGKTVGDTNAPTPDTLASHRRTHDAHFFRRINRDGCPDTWGIRLFNGAGEQQMTILLPNPFMATAHKFADPPDWSKLDLWDSLRHEILGLPSDPADRSGVRMIYP